jgi:hypothetical protein
MNNLLDNRNLRELVECLDKLLVCYRLNKRPTGKLLDRIAELRKEVKPVSAENKDR